MQHSRATTPPRNGGSHRPELARLPSLTHDVLAELPGPHDMHRRIHRERQLCERGRPPFSVVVFDVGEPAIDPALAVNLVSALRQRMRLSDEIGWFGRRRIAVLLPVTPHAGAHEFAVGLTGLLASQGHQVAFQVFCL